MDTADPPCDFDAFVAERRGVSRDEARRLVQSWLTDYRPPSKPAVVIGAEPHACTDSSAGCKEDENVAPGPSLGVAHR